MKFNLTVIGGDSSLRDPRSRLESPTAALGRTLATFEQMLAGSFETLHVGGSVQKFELVIELVALAGQSRFFSCVRNFTTYRRQRRGLLSVVQLDWPSLQEMGPEEQTRVLFRGLVEACDRAVRMEVKPRDFCDVRFRQFAHELAEGGGVDIAAAPMQPDLALRRPAPVQAVARPGSHSS